jgi:hypothetical protein
MTLASAPRRTEEHRMTTDTVPATIEATDPAIRPFEVHVTDEQVADLRRRIVAWRPPEPETVPDQSQGIQLETVRQLADYWSTEHDWRRVEARLQSLPQFVTTIDGLDIHFIHVQSRHEHALERGGHFAAWEQPDLFTRELRAAFSSLRTR